MKRMFANRLGLASREGRLGLLLAVVLLLPTASAGGSDASVDGPMQSGEDVAASSWDLDSRMTVNRADIRTLGDSWSQSRVPDN